MKNFIIVLVLLGLFAACKKPVEQKEVVDVNAIKTDIQEFENQNAAWINSKNVDSIMQYYADDAISYDSNSKPLIGKEQIRKSMESASKSRSTNTKLTYSVKEVYPSEDGNRIVEIGQYRIQDPNGVNYGSGTYFSILEKRDGKYVCIRDIQTPDSMY